MEKEKHFWQVLSADESRVSAVVVAFLATTAVALWSYVSRDYIGPEMILLMQTMIAAVTGMNMIKGFTEKKPKQEDNKPVDIDKSRNMV